MVQMASIKTRLDMSHRGEELVKLFTEDMSRAYDILPYTVIEDKGDVQEMEKWCKFWRKQNRPYLVVERDQVVEEGNDPVPTYVVLVDFKELHADEE